jgi:MFS transporter, ACS family, tartrate transporter
VTGVTSFYGLRFALGVAEVGFFPGIILYLTYWFPRAERARIVSLFMTAVPAMVIGGADLRRAAWTAWPRRFGRVAVALHHRGHPRRAARHRRLGVPHRSAEGCRLAAPEEWRALEERLEAEADETRTHGYEGIGQALTHPRVIELGLLYFCIVVGLYGIGFWMPQVLQTFGLSNLSIGFLTAIPYLIAAVGMVMVGHHSDAAAKRIWHVALPLFLSGAAFVWSAHAVRFPS